MAITAFNEEGILDESLRGSGNFSSDSADSDVPGATTVNGAWVYIIWITLFACLSLWCMCSLRSCTSQRHIMSKDELDALPESERRQRLVKEFEERGTQMEVSKNDLGGSLAFDEEAQSTDDTGDQQQEESTPRGGQIEASLLFVTRVGDGSAGTDQTCKVSVPNCCAICLEDYKIGEYVVWSANDGCPHVYHRDCMVDYLVTHRSDNNPCPSCRRNYLDGDTSAH